MKNFKTESWPLSPGGFRYDREFILTKFEKEKEKILRLDFFPKMLKIQPRIDLMKNQIFFNVQNKEIGLNLESKKQNGTCPNLEKIICGKK